ncbi:MAG: lipopolysaccharide biosynthesis protein [Oscillospiraceae bacterium]|nr:lipopolysaccharide biosynthesis protein [Oscillospiraceae bacterium]
MINNRISSAFFFKFAERALVKIVGLVISVVLARLLEPETFGLLAIISVFINLANTFVLNGFTTALVQNRTANHKDYSTVYYTTSGIAIVLIMILFFIAPYVAKVYHAPELITPLRVMALSLIPGSLNAVQNAKLQRELRLKEMMICNIFATVIAGIAGILIAMTKPGIWALVVYQCGHTILSAVVMLPISGWYPKREFSIDRVKEFFSFGSRILVSSLLCSIYSDLRALIIGYRYSTLDLAQYTKAQQYPETISYTVDSTISTVLIPVMSSLQDSVGEMHSLMMKIVRVSVYMVTPMMLGLAAVSETFIPLLLTEKWNGCIPLMRYFCFAYLSLPIGTAGLCYIKACGRSDIYLRAEVIRRMIMLCILLITVFSFNTVNAIAVGYAFSAWLDAVIVIVFTRHCGGPKFTEYCKITWKTYLSGLAMYFVVVLLNKISCLLFYKLILQITSGICIYIGMSLVSKEKSLIDIYQKIKSSASK